MNWRGQSIMVWRYICNQRIKAFLVVSALTLVLLMPLLLLGVVKNFEHHLQARAKSTPLIVGPRSGKLELTLAVLNFQQGDTPVIFQETMHELSKKIQGSILPIHNRHRVTAFPTLKELENHSFPLVGTDHGYFELRHMKPQLGRLPIYLGEVVLGSEVAKTWGIHNPLGQVLSVPHHLLDISKTVQLRLPIVGILAVTGGPDDHAVFTGLHSTWALDGLAHSHRDLSPNDAIPENSTEHRLVTPANFSIYAQLNENNRDQYHIHESPSKLPLSALIVLPKRHLDQLHTLSIFENHPRVMAVKPQLQISRLMNVVLNLSAFFQTNLFISLGACVTLMIVILLLSNRLRSNERKALHLIGFPAHLYPTLIIFEILFYTLTAIALAGTTAFIIQNFLTLPFIQMIFGAL